MQRSNILFRVVKNSAYFGNRRLDSFLELLKQSTREGLAQIQAFCTIETVAAARLVSKNCFACFGRLWLTGIAAMHDMVREKIFYDQLFFESQKAEKTHHLHSNWKVYIVRWVVKVNYDLHTFLREGEAIDRQPNRYKSFSCHSASHWIPADFRRKTWKDSEQDRCMCLNLFL